MTKILGLILFGLLMLPGISLAEEYTDQQYMLDLKGLRKESKQLVDDYAQQKKEFEQKLYTELNALTTSEEDSLKRVKRMEEAKLEQEKMQADLKAKVNAMETREYDLKVRRQETIEKRQLTPAEKSRLFKARTISENKKMGSIEERIRKQNEEIAAERKAREDKLKKQAQDKAKAKVADPKKPAIQDPTANSPAKKYQKKKLYGMPKDAQGKKY